MELLSRVCVVDIETTGLQKQLDRIIELGVVEYVDNELKLEFSKLFGGGRCIPFLSKSIHKIKDRDRKGKPTFEECAEKVSGFLSNCYLVTHNGKRFDIPMLEIKLGKYKIVNSKYIDTLVIARKLDKFKDKNKDLKSLASYYNIDYGNHRGLGDAQTTFELLKCLMQEMNITKLEDLKS